MIKIIGCIAVASVTVLTIWTVPRYEIIVDTSRLIARQLLSASLYEQREVATLPVENIRGQFSSIILTVPNATTSYHSHPFAAAQRAAAGVTMERLARSLGLRPYFFQYSNSDLRKNREGSRSYYWAKDVSVKPAFPNIKPTDLIAMVDVDYYVDMPKFLATNFNPTILYTLSPMVAAETCKDYSFFFNEDNQVEFRVPGGGSYTHEVWNYSLDHILVRRKILGIPCSAATYNVDRRHVGGQHYLVLLTPVSRWSWWNAWMTWFIDGSRLERLHPVVTLHRNILGEVKEEKFVRMNVISQDGAFVATGKPGEYINALVEACSDSAIEIAAAASIQGITLPAVQSYVPKKEEASIVFAYHRYKQPAKAPYVFPLEYSVRNYQFEPENFAGMGKPSLVPFMAPIFDGCYAPTCTPENERVLVEERINKVKAPEIKPSKFLEEVLEAFLEQFIPEPNKGDPMSHEYVYEMQGRPTQRKILRDAEFTTPTESARNVQMFMKKEAYADIKPPRPISTINGRDKLEYSAYIYAIAEFVKATPWYAFGHTPKEISTRITKVLENATCATNSDFSKFDGRVSGYLRELERRVLLRYFRSDYHAQLIDLHGSQYGLKAFGTFGTRYNTGTARASGSPETAAFNSIANAFVAFLALSMTRWDGSHLSPEEAYECLGIYGGDDGLTADVDPDRYVRAAEMVGQKLEVEMVKVGQPGIKFLARVYGPDVWYGDTNSCCDLARQISKFHTTVALPTSVKPVEKLIEKARAYYYTDKNTPIIGPFVSKVIELTKGTQYETLSLNNLRIWGSDNAPSDQYDNELADWMLAYVEMTLPTFNHEHMKQFLDKAKTLDEMLRPFCCGAAPEPKPTADVVVQIGGDNREVKAPVAEVPKKFAWKKGSRTKVLRVAGLPKRPTPAGTLVKKENAKQSKTQAKNQATPTKRRCSKTR